MTTERAPPLPARSLGALLPVEAFARTLQNKLRSLGGSQDDVSSESWSTGHARTLSSSSVDSSSDIFFDLDLSPQSPEEEVTSSELAGMIAGSGNVDSFQSWPGPQSPQSDCSSDYFDPDGFEDDRGHQVCAASGVPAHTPPQPVQNGQSNGLSSPLSSGALPYECNQCYSIVLNGVTPYDKPFCRCPDDAAGEQRSPPVSPSKKRPWNRVQHRYKAGTPEAMREVSKMCLEEPEEEEDKPRPCKPLPKLSFAKSSETILQEDVIQQLKQGGDIPPELKNGLCPRLEGESRAPVPGCRGLAAIKLAAEALDALEQDCLAEDMGNVRIGEETKIDDSSRIEDSSKIKYSSNIEDGLRIENGLGTEDDSTTADSSRTEEFPSQTEDEKFPAQTEEERSSIEGRLEKGSAEVEGDDCSSTEETSINATKEPSSRRRSRKDSGTRSDDGDSLDDDRPRIRRCSSLKTGKTPPGTPGRKKIVRFADVLGLDLADVRTFLDEIPKVPTSAYDDLQDVDPLAGQETAPVAQLSLAFQAAPLAPVETFGVRPTRVLVPLFQQPGGMTDFMDKVRDRQVCLENAVVKDLSLLSVAGQVRVRNLDFHKTVHIRYSTDGWKSFADLQATYVLNSCDGFSDKFTFTLFAAHTMSVGQRLEMAVRFQCKGHQYWDNNSGANYCFQCLPPSAGAPPLSLPSPDDSWKSFY